MPAIEARRRRKVIAIPDERLWQPTTFRLRPYDEGDHRVATAGDHLATDSVDAQASWSSIRPCRLAGYQPWLTICSRL
jgi:hypothetical protein